jgi:hypothetical protein
MFCDACGADLGNRPNKFCPQCGAPLQAAASGPEKPATPETAAMPLPEPPPLAATVPETSTEALIPPLSSITLDAIPAFDFVSPVTTPAASTETAPGLDAGPPEPAQTPPDMLSEPEETAADPRPEPVAPAVSPEEAACDTPVRETIETVAETESAPPSIIQDAEPSIAASAPVAPEVFPPETVPDANAVLPGQEIEPAPPTVIPDFEPSFAASAPIAPEVPPPGTVPDGNAVLPGWEERYAPEISTMTSLTEWGRIEPTMSGTRAFPLPVEPPPRANGPIFASIGAAAVLVLALSGIWWFSDRTASAPETFPKDTPELSAETPPPQASETNEIPPAETLATPTQETGEPSPALDPASRLKPDAPLLVIPPLPTNQQPGKHNRIDNTIEPLPDIPLASEASASVPLPATISRTQPPSVPSSPTASVRSPPPARSSPPSRPAAIAPIPLPSPPMPRQGADAAASSREPVRVAPPPPIDTPKRNPPPAIAVPSIDEPVRKTQRAASPPAQERPQQDSPSWRNTLRRELSNCEDFFCRERARKQYCSERWKTLPECRGASL